MIAFIALAGCRLHGDAQRTLPSPTTEPRDPVVTGNRIRLWPNSARLEPRVPYRFSLLTHCGLHRSYPDFDGSFWRYVGPEVDGADSAPPGFDDPSDAGTMTLLAEGKAEFRSASGEVARFQRVQGPIEIPPCY